MNLFFELERDIETNELRIQSLCKQIDQYQYDRVRAKIRKNAEQEFLAEQRYLYAGMQLEKLRNRRTKLEKERWPFGKSAIPVDTYANPA